MARTVTVLELKTRARQRADAVGDTSWVTDAELLDYLDTGYTRLVNLLLKADIHLFETTSDITTDGTNDAYDLPDDFYKLLGVDYRWSSSPVKYVSVPVVTFGERNRYTSLFVSTLYGAYAAGYRLVSGQVQFYPLPPSGQVYRLFYIPAAGKFTGLVDGDLVDGISGYDELLVICAAVQMAIKEGNSEGVQLLNKELAEMIDEIATAGVDRSPVQSMASDDEDGYGLDRRYPYGRIRWRDA
jgi:hypothetical protein